MVCHFSSAFRSVSFGAFSAVGIISLWFGMIWDCWFASKKPNASKLRWTLLLVLTNMLGALIATIVCSIGEQRQTIEFWANRGPHSNYRGDVREEQYPSITDWLITYKGEPAGTNGAQTVCMSCQVVGKRVI
jgi:hypothetical protein